MNRNAKVYIAARNQKKANDAINELKNETGKEALFLKLDLADLKSVKAAAVEFSRYSCYNRTRIAVNATRSKEKELHVLFNNGGVMMPPIDQLTTDGYDLQFGTNVLGMFLPAFAVDSC